MNHDEHEHGEAWMRPMVPQDFAVLGLNFVTSVAAAATETLMMARDLLGAHVNWLQGQRRFHQEAAMEIERLTSGDE